MLYVVVIMAITFCGGVKGILKNIFATPKERAELFCNLFSATGTDCVRLSTTTHFNEHQENLDTITDVSF